MNVGEYVPSGVLGALWDDAAAAMTPPITSTTAAEPTQNHHFL